MSDTSVSDHELTAPTRPRHSGLNLSWERILIYYTADDIAPRHSGLNLSWERILIYCIADDIAPHHSGLNTCRESAVWILCLRTVEKLS